MIKINNITRGRFGNRVLQFNSALQLANLIDTKLYCSMWEGFNFFKGFEKYTFSKEREETLLKWNECLSMSIEEIKELHGTKDIVIDDPAYLLHNVFFKLTKTHPREFLKIKDEYKISPPKEKTNVGIHIRGDDIISRDGNDGREIHDSEYYIDSIKSVEKEPGEKRYFVCTDDINFNTFIKVFNYLKSTNKDFFLGPSTSSPDKINHFSDFSLLTECDILIASSSTYSISAAIVGKNKKIIHSKNWLEKNVNHTPWHRYEDPKHVRDWQISFDNFWVDVYRGGNTFYNAWKII
tara:strand:+ start:94 stop:975 length:882 start_codon:yes stop_codon:yes gene_type:complete